MSAASRSSVSGPVPPPHAGLRAWARNSPWVMMAVLLHVLLVTILSVVVIRAQRREASSQATAMVVARPQAELPPAIEPAPLLERDCVPPLASVEPGVVNPDEHLIPEAAAGRPGPITDELDPTLDPGHFNPDPAALAELPSGATGGTPIGVGRVGHHGTGTSAFVGRVPGG